MMGNMLLNLMAKLAVRALGFVVFIYQTNYLKERYGIYVFVVQLAMALLAFIDLGWSVVIVREIGRAPEKASQYLANFLALETFVAAFFACGLIGYVIIAGESPEKIRLAAIAAIGVYFGGLSRAPLGVLVARQRSGLASMADLGTNLLSSLATLIAVHWRAPISAFIWINNGYYIVLFAVFCAMAARVAGPLRWRIDRALWRGLLRLGLPSSMIAGTYVLYTTLDVMMLSRMSTDLRMSIYGVALKLTNPLLMFVEASMMAIYPVLAARHDTDPAGFRFLLNKSLKLMLGLGMPIALGISLLSPEIIQALITPRLWASIVTLRILVWRLPLLFAYSPINHALLAGGRLKTLAGMNIAAVLMNFILNLLLIPRYGENGAAIATVCSHATILLIYLSLRSTFYSVGMRWADLARLILSLLAMAAVVWIAREAMANTPALIRLAALIALGAITYSITAFATHFLGPEERSFLTRYFRR